MEDEEYRKLFEVERVHWFYSGKREIAHLLISRLFPREEIRHLDAGCGSGLLVRELGQAHRSFGVDSSVSSLIYAKQIRSAFGSMGSLPCKSNAFDCTTSFDVLEHLEDDRKALGELIRVTRPGGFIFINVPAFTCLWSDWDEALHHKRRYTKRAFSRIIPSEEVALQSLFYMNSLLFFPILIYRCFRRLFPRAFPSRLEDEVPFPWVNALLQNLFVAPVKWNLLFAPFGTSLFVILKKRDQDPSLLR
jgi:SAM-dependent methyltransferase